MEIFFTKQNKNLLIKIEGEIDHHNAAKLRETLDEKIRTSKALNLIFDLSGVSFMDSSGIGMVIGRYKTAKAYGGKVILASVPENIDRILSLSGVYTIIERYKTTKDALMHI